MLATLVDFPALWQTAWTAAVAGVAVCLVFALTVRGAARSTDLRREGQAVGAVVYAVIAVAGVAASLGAIAYGITIITTK